VPPVPSPLPPDPDRDATWVAAVGRDLLAWYDAAARPLPWRSDRPDPYRVLVSEFLLVQTTVAAAIPYYHRFLGRFPTPAALAAAPIEDVLKTWEGLGYYRRARQLHAAAQAIVAEHGGAVPGDPAALRALPGVGRYIAGAVASIAFGRPEPILEANTQRLLARLLTLSTPLAAKSTQDRLWEAAARLVPADRPGPFNQALMDLGAMVCIPRNPRCLGCPVALHCRARALGRQDDLPVVPEKAAPLPVEEAAALVAHAGRLLVVRRAPGTLWGGFWEFPTIHVSGADPAGRGFGTPVGLADGVRRLTGLIVAPEAKARKTVRFGVTKHRVTLHAHPAALLAPPGTPTPGPNLDRVQWATPAELDALPFGSAQRKLKSWAVDHLLGPGA
jgi:A/G-specific adenine glycosylase